MSTQRITVEQKELKAGLKSAGRALAGRSTLPILSNYLLKSDGEGWLHIEGNNLEIGVRTKVVCRGDAFAITLPGKLLSDLVGSVSGVIDLAYNHETQSVKFTAGGSSATIKGIEADEFPSFPSITGDGVVFSAAVLADTIRNVVGAAAAEHTNPILQGVNIEIKESTATLAAIDGYRLNVQPMRIATAWPEHLSVTLPARSMTELAALLPSDDTEVTMVLSETGGQILFRFGDTELCSRIIDGKFPDYHRFIPPTSDEQCHIILDTKSLLSAVKRVALIAVSAGNIVTLATDTDGTLTVKANAAEVGDAFERIDAIFDQPEIIKQNALNIKYLQDALGVIATESVKVIMTTENSPVLFHPVGGDGLCLIMPMRLP